MADPVGQALAALGKADGFLGKVLGPLTEGSEYLSDRIRFARWKASIATLERAERIAREKGISTGQLSIRFLAPWLEGSSFQPENSDQLQSLWSTLLVSATQTEAVEDLVFIDILKKIGEQEAKLLAWMAEQLGREGCEDYLYNPGETQFSESTYRVAQAFAEQRLIQQFATRDPKHNQEVHRVARDLFRKFSHKPLFPTVFTFSLGASFSASHEPAENYVADLDGVSVDLMKYLMLVQEVEGRAYLDTKTGEISEWSIPAHMDDEIFEWGVKAVFPTRFGVRLACRCLWPDLL